MHIDIIMAVLCRIMHVTDSIIDGREGLLYDTR